MRISNRTYGILLILPSIAFIVFTIFGPLCYGFWTSLNIMRGFSPTMTFAGFHNYIRVFKDPSFLPSLGRTFFFACVTIITQASLGLISALVLNEEFKGRTIVRSLTLFPYIVATIVAVLTWKWMYDPMFGIFNHILLSLGIVKEPILWLGESLALPSIILTATWQFYPFSTLCILARLQTIRPELYDAAKIDGAGAGGRFMHITLPEISYVMALVVLIRFIFMFSKFDLIWVMTRGGPGTATHTLPIMIYLKSFLQMDYSLGSAVSMILFIILFIVALIYMKLSRL